MDLIKMISTTADKTTFSGAEVIQGYTSTLWVERYREAGEFEINAPLSSGLKEFLPIGTFVSHVETRELMMVENHEIDQPLDGDPTIKITGRSFVAFLENRIIGGDWATESNQIQDYVIGASPSWNQACQIIDDHIMGTADPKNSLVNVMSRNACHGTGTSEDRKIDFGTVYERVLELLKIDDVGIRSLRPTHPYEDAAYPNYTYFEVYQGVDRSNKVHFSWHGGDLNSLNYLFTNKAHWNFVRVMGKWVQVYVDGPERGYFRRMGIVNASDIDEQQQSYPSGLALTWITIAMIARGREALAGRKYITITATDVSPTTKLRHHVDYNVGDLVTVDGNFGQKQVMRVVECADGQDENGESCHPTLEVLGADDV